MISAIIPAAGGSLRMNSKINKQFMSIAGQPVLTRSLLPLKDFVDEVIVVARRGEEDLCRECVSGAVKNFQIVLGGRSRQESVYNGLKHCTGEYVMVHDGNRPLVSADLVRRVLSAARKYGAAIPALPVVDTIKKVCGDRVQSTLPRHLLYAVQTPQVFKRSLLWQAYTYARENNIEATDDSALVEAVGHPVYVVQGEMSNVKITTPDDFRWVQDMFRYCRRKGSSAIRTGIGYDVHQLVPGRKLILGGVDIPFAKGLHGHSDADVLIHAIMDALLGAAGLGDIGRHFPDTDPAWAGARSTELLARVVDMLAAKGLHPANIDAIIIAQTPKLSPYVAEMVSVLSGITKLDADCINIKATTTEGLGFLGRGEGIAAQSVCTVEYSREEE